MGMATITWQGHIERKLKAKQSSPPRPPPAPCPDIRTETETAVLGRDSAQQHLAAFPGNPDAGPFAQTRGHRTGPSLASAALCFSGNELEWPYDNPAVLCHCPLCDSAIVTQPGRSNAPPYPPPEPHPESPSPWSPHLRPGAEDLRVSPGCHRGPCQLLPSTPCIGILEGGDS